MTTKLSSNDRLQADVVDDASNDHATNGDRPEEQILGQFIPLLYHYNMLQDEDRMGAFRDAIDLVVQPGMHVVELGGGTGVLSSFAARRGAEVTCVERNSELVSCAKKFLRINGLDKRVRVIQEDAMRFAPDKPVDVVVCEMLHVGLLREKQAQVIDAFKRNYTRVYGSRLPIFLPEVSILMAQPVQHSFDFFGYLAPVPLFQAPLMDQPRTKELAALHPYAQIPYDERIPMGFDVRQTLTIKQPGQINAIRFVTQNVIAVDTEKQHAINWPNQCLVLPLETRLEVAAGQSIEMSFRYRCGGSIQQLSDTIICTAIDS